METFFSCRRLIFYFTIWMIISQKTKGQCVVSNLLATAASSSQIDVSWSCSEANNEFQLTIRLIDRDQCNYLSETYQNETLITEWISSLSYSWHGLYAYSTYSISVQARRSLSEGAGYEYGGLVDATTTTSEAAPTGTPFSVFGWSIGAEHACLGFQPVTCGFRHGNIEMYTYVLNNTNSSVVSNMTFTPGHYGSLSLSTCIRPLPCLNLYVLQMAGVTSTGVGPYYSWNFWTRLQAADRRATLNSSTNELLVTWSPSTTLGCPEVAMEEYLVYVHRNEGRCSSSYNTNSQHITSNTSLLLSLNPYSSYQVSVRVLTDLPHSSNTVWSSSTPQGAPATSPSNVRLIASSEDPVSLTYGWDEIPCQQRNGIIIGYPWEIVKAGAGDLQDTVVTGELEATNVIITDVLPNTAYKFRVAAKTIAGTGVFSEYVVDPDVSPEIGDCSISRTVPPSGVTRIPASTTSCSLVFTWDNYGCLNDDNYIWQIGMAIEDTEDESIVITGEVERNSVTVSDLLPNVEYKFRVAARTSNGTSIFSDYVMATTSELVLEEVSMINIQPADPGELFVHWIGPSSNCITYFLEYQLIVDECGQTLTQQIVEIYGNSTTTSATLTGLKPHATYTVYVRAVSRGASSSVQSRTGKTAPQAPQVPDDVSIPSTDSGSITIRWYQPDFSRCLITGYDIQVWKTGPLSNQTIVHHVTSDELPIQDAFEFTITGLQRNVRYYVQVRTLSSVGESDWSVAMSAVTKEGIPGPPADATLTEVNQTSVTVEWDQPLFRNGNIYLYHIDYRAIQKPYEKDFDRFTENLVSSFCDISNSTDTDHSYTLSNLEPSTLYEILVSARTIVGSGNPIRLETQTMGYSGISAPFGLNVKQSTSTTIEIEFAEASLDEKYLVSYKVGVQKHSTLNKRDVADFDSDPRGYITAQFSKFDFRGTFIVGDGKTYGGFHNKPLDESEEYWIHVGAVSGIMQNEVISWNADPLYASTVSETISKGFLFEGILAGGIVGFIILIAVILLVVVLLCRKRREKDLNDTEYQAPKFKQSNIPLDAWTNQGFTEDNGIDYHHYEDNMSDQDYETMISSRLDIAWKDIRLSGRILGKGAFGEVQLGIVMSKGKEVKVAIKTMKGDTPDVEKRLFREEFETMTKIGPHPNVINLLGSCQHAGILYVALEYAHFGDLRNYLRKSRCEVISQNASKVISNLLPGQMLKFAVGVAKGMRHLATCGIIHRDLAARNVLVDRNQTPKVADFGLSREEDVYVKKTTQRVPTRWLSLESLTMKTYTTKSDVWSFGILLWEIATFGGTPYTDLETRTIAYHLRDGYRMPKPDNCEDDMYVLMLKCWQENPEDRPSFREIVDILTEMESKDKIYMSTHYYQNFKHATINTDKDDK